MHENFIRSFFTWYAHRLAFLVGATEAFTFSARRNDGDFEFDLVVHIRPNEDRPEVLAASRNAFIEIARPCITRGVAGTIGIEKPDGKQPPLFCLVIPLLEDGTIFAVMGFISRCENMNDAKKKLNAIRQWVPKP